ncbi:MAG TPA: HgcAB-associated protein [Clostridia bacterium]|nr:HgcAB-associated protein [Clostridia bacterium]
MADKKQKENCCTPQTAECCKVESVVTIDERGQMILPKDLREKAGLVAGDKLVIATSMKDGKLAFLMMFRADDFNDMVKGAVRPAMRMICMDDEERK